MPQATRDIKRRIKSISSTKKVTKAMELVSAAKMRKATGQVLASRSYAVLAAALIKKLSQKTAEKYHVLLRPRQEIKTIAVLLITSNRGLAGSFNTSVIQQAVGYINRQTSQGKKVELVVLGKKGRDFMAKRGFTIAADFPKVDVAPEVAAIRPIARLLLKDFLTGKYDKVVLAYTDFISILAAKPRILEILPLKQAGDDKDLGRVETEFSLAETASSLSGLQSEYIFEPSPVAVLNQLLPRMLETQIYQAILESDAAEHSARMVAMKNASEAAGDMIDGLTLIFNKARQSSITAELADISGGRAAVE